MRGQIFLKGTETVLLSQCLTTITPCRLNDMGFLLLRQLFYLTNFNVAIKAFREIGDISFEIDVSANLKKLITNCLNPFQEKWLPYQ